MNRIEKIYNNVYVINEKDQTLMSIYRKKNGEIKVGKYSDQIKGKQIVSQAITFAEETL